MTLPVKKTYIDIAVEIANFHIRQCKDENGWTVEDTAKILNRSKGSVSQYITIAFWYQTHGSKISKFRSMNDALDFIRDKQKEMKMRIIDK